MTLFWISKGCPPEEKYSLTDQMRRSSRSVNANLAEAWRKRRYKSAFVAKLSDCEAEAAEAQTWIQFAVACNYLDTEHARSSYQEYDEIQAMLVAMINNANQWTIQ